MLKRFIRIIGGDPNQREIDQYAEIAAQINELENQYEALSDEDLRAKTNEFRKQIADYTQGISDSELLHQANQEALEEILPDAFAVVREASKRTIGLRHYDVQLIGGVAMHKGRIAEMRTGEGKTLVATLPIYLNALTGRGVHLITVNDYLARRDARWMAPIYNMLGLSVGVLQMAARTEFGKKAFMVDLERESPREDQNQLRMIPRQEAYAADITYGTNSEFGFDYLRDNMTPRLTDRVQRGHHYAIIDEVDNVLIDEARTPLIISGPAQDEADWYIKMAKIIRQLRPEDYEVEEKDRTVTLTEIGEGHVEELINMPLRDPERPEDVTLEQARVLGYLEQALRAQHLFHRNKDYLVQAGKVVIIDEFTGRLMPGRRWSDGLHQAVEAKEGVRVQSESVTYATITIQNYFRMYDKLSGMTGTAVTEAEEFDKIYQLNVLAIPTNLEYEANHPDSGLVQLEDKDESGYKYTYYAREEDPENAPVYWKRKDYPDVVYRTEEAKLRAIAREILIDQALGRPVLLGTTSVEMSERVATRLKSDPLRKLAQTILLRDAWVMQNDHAEDGRQIPELQFLNDPLGDLNTNEMRKLARELEVPFNPLSEENLDRLLYLLILPDSSKQRLSDSLQGGINHQVLNARKHTEESQIIEGAGAFGAVTIATNMAGRGVDIILGGNLPNQTVYNVTRIARNTFRRFARLEQAEAMEEILRTGVSSMGYGKMSHIRSLVRWRKEFTDIEREDIGIYDTDLSHFDQFIHEYDRIFELGGLHVIGSERHDARRIDNQLRGRSARQGDPGSSRFYLSMEDELMRLFGGQQADTLMQRLNIDDALPLEMGLVSRIVEQSQTRVEGANFDVRKHLLEYDDVLNTQRATIYTQRDRIFEKEDLTEDVTEMLRAEVNRRVPIALEDDGEMWKLLAWLNQIQPTLQVKGAYFPSYSMRLLVTDILKRLPQNADPSILQEEVQQQLTSVSVEVFNAEREHHLNAIELLLDQTEIWLENQISERTDTLEIYVEGLDVEDEEQPRRPNEIIADLSSAIKIPLKLSNNTVRSLREDPQLLFDEAHEQIQDTLINQSITRVMGAIARRIGATLDLDSTSMAEQEWETIADRLLDAVDEIFDQRYERYLGENGAIIRDIETQLPRLGDLWKKANLEQILLVMLLLIPQGSRTAFDKKTHRRVQQHVSRLNFTYHNARYLEGREPEEITQDVLDHLEKAQQAVRLSWGIAEWSRLEKSPIAEWEQDTWKGIENTLNIQLEPSKTLTQIPGDLTERAIDELGRRTLTEVYRQLMLGIIGELWVDFLTQMEALRVSIRLEAYAQRDPLVQYKSKAFELFQELLNNMRTGVVTRMFTYKPRDISSVQTTLTKQSISAPDNDANKDMPEKTSSPKTKSQEERPAQAANATKRKKRKRRRHR